MATLGNEHIYCPALDREHLLILVKLSRDLEVGLSYSGPHSGPNLGVLELRLLFLYPGFLAGVCSFLHPSKRIPPCALRPQGSQTTHFS